jgi:hypothetical protein
LWSGEETKGNATLTAMPFAITPQEKTATQSTFYPHFLADPFASSKLNVMETFWQSHFASSKLNVTKNWY